MMVPMVIDPAVIVGGMIVVLAVVILTWGRLRLRASRSKADHQGGGPSSRAGDN